MRTKENMVMTPDEVVDRYADMVYRLALSEMKNKADAEDIFQEVFVRLVKHLHKLKSEEHIKAWLIRVTINCARKSLASYWRRNVQPIEKEDAWGGFVGESSQMPEEHPVSEAVAGLPEKYRSIVYLFYYEEFHISEIARLTGQKETTVKSQLFRARELLREQLEGDRL